jgi:drug/metabolite transporter (DMT)-like permease
MGLERQVTTRRLAGYLMVVTSSLLFGFNGNLSRLLFDGGITPVTLVEFRMLIGGVSLLAVLLVGQRQGLKLQRRYWGWIVLFGLSLAIVTFTYFEAISRLPLAIAYVIQFSAPAWMTLGESIWRRKIPSTFVITALAFTFGGIILLTGVWRNSLNGLDSIGLLFASLSIVAFIVYLLVGRRIGQDLPALTATTYGAFVAGIFWLIVQPPWIIPASTWTVPHMLLIAVVGIVGMAIPFSLVLASLRRVDATRVAIVSMLELVAGGVIAYFWLGQHLDVWQIAGCLSVMVGITILQVEAGMQRQ